MIKRALAAAFIIFGFIVPARNVYASASPAPSKELRKALDEFHSFYKKGLADTGIVGSSLVLLHDNQVVDAVSYGLADKERAIPAGERTIYHWASITKTMTGIAIMQLRDRGLLSLDDPIVKYIPELRQVHDPFGDMGEITLKHLMTHSAGFRGATWPWKDKPWQPHEPTRWEQLAAMFPYTEIEFKPGSKWSYSNPGIIFLGRVIELLTGDDFEVYIDKNILKPLEMHESYFDATPYHLLKNRARSYFLTRRRADRRAVRRRYRDHRFQRRPERAYHGLRQVPGFPDGRSEETGGLRRRPEARLARGDVPARPADRTGRAARAGESSSSRSRRGSSSSSRNTSVGPSSPIAATRTRSRPISTTIRRRGRPTPWLSTPWPWPKDDKDAGDPRRARGNWTGPSGIICSRRSFRFWRPRNSRRTRVAAGAGSG